MLKRRKTVAAKSLVYRDYWLMLDKQDNRIRLELNYSGETGDEDFPNLCVELLSACFQEYFCITEFDKCGDSGFCLPEHWLSRENRIFEDRKILVTIQCGLDAENFHAYFQEKEKYFRISHLQMLGYRAKPVLETPFSFQEEYARNQWDGCAFYEEMQDSLLLIFLQGKEGELIQLVSDVCEKYGKNLKQVWV